MTTKTKKITKEIKKAFKENKTIILTISAIFIISFIIGFLLIDYIQAYITPVVNTFQERIQTGQVQLTTNSLYINNLQATLIIFLGSFLLGIFGIIAIITNALLIGYFAALYSTNGQTLVFILLIIPHGIFEIPSLILASSAGLITLKFLINFLKNLISPDYQYTEIFDPIYNLDKISTKDTIKMSWRKNSKTLKQAMIILIISIILLLIAAFIEANITQQLASFILNSI